MAAEGAATGRGTREERESSETIYCCRCWLSLFPLLHRHSDAPCARDCRATDSCSTLNSGASSGRRLLLLLVLLILLIPSRRDCDSSSSRLAVGDEVCSSVMTTISIRQHRLQRDRARTTTTRPADSSMGEARSSRCLLSSSERSGRYVSFEQRKARRDSYRAGTLSSALDSGARTQTRPARRHHRHPAARRHHL